MNSDSWLHEPVSTKHVAYEPTQHDRWTPIAINHTATSSTGSVKKLQQANQIEDYFYVRQVIRQPSFALFQQSRRQILSTMFILCVVMSLIEHKAVIPQDAFCNSYIHMRLLLESASGARRGKRQQLKTQSNNSGKNLQRVAVSH